MFLLTRGRCHSFLLKDWGDYQAEDEQFGTGDGTTTTFQLKKVTTLSGTSATYTRTITHPLAGAIISVDGVATGATVSTLTGQVTFASAPDEDAVLTWSGEFRVPVRFDNDYLPFSLDNRRSDGYAKNGSVDLIEVLGEDDDAT